MIATHYFLLFLAKRVETSGEGIQYKLICQFQGKSGKSVCEERDDEKLSKIIKSTYLDSPSPHPYAFRANPPELNGQVGVPTIVDKILGKISYFTFSHAIFRMVKKQA